MLQAFTVSLREALQTSLILLLILSQNDIKRDRSLQTFLFIGLFFAFLVGYGINFIPSFKEIVSDIKSWSFWRYTLDLAMMYLSIPLFIRPLNPGKTLIRLVLFLWGLSLLFFDAQATGFLVHDIGLMAENPMLTTLVSLGGIALGFLPLVFYRQIHRIKQVERALTVPMLLVFTGAWRVTFGGLHELTKEDILQTLNRGFLDFIQGFVGLIQHNLMLDPHPFIAIPLKGLFEYLSSERISMTLTVLTIMTPPLFVLIKLFSSPDPLLYNLKTNAERRLRIADFRMDLTRKSILPITGILIMILMLHASSFAVNPLFDPDPLPVRETEGKVVIPLKGKLGDLTDGMLHKYVAFWGNKEIIFLAIVKPDGTVGLALDQCEICRPADWNTEAQGYAQKGKHLVCKYCMTPITTDTVNKPGGCNPIPVPFRMDDERIVIDYDDLVRTFKEAEKLEKKGTHL